MNDQEYKRRLLVLADHMEYKVAPNRFSFTKWAGIDWGGKPDLSCGTVACVFGHATTIQEFQALGLRLYRKFDNKYSTPYIGMGKDTTDDSVFNAAAELFDLDESGFDFLFIPLPSIDIEERVHQRNKFGKTSLPWNCSPGDAAEQIRHFVRHKYG